MAGNRARRHAALCKQVHSTSDPCVSLGALAMHRSGGRGQLCRWHTTDPDTWRLGLSPLSLTGKQSILKYCKQSRSRGAACSLRPCTGLKPLSSRYYRTFKFVKISCMTLPQTAEHCTPSTCALPPIPSDSETTPWPPDPPPAWLTPSSAPRTHHAQPAVHNPAPHSRIAAVRDVCPAPQTRPAAPHGLPAAGCAQQPAS